MVEVVMSMYLSPISTTIPPMMVGSVWDRGVGEGDKNERERERRGQREWGDEGAPLQISRVMQHRLAYLCEEF